MPLNVGISLLRRKRRMPGGFPRKRRVRPACSRAHQSLSGETHSKLATLLVMRLLLRLPLSALTINKTQLSQLLCATQRKVPPFMRGAQGKPNKTGLITMSTHALFIAAFTLALGLGNGSHASETQVLNAAGNNAISASETNNGGTPAVTTTTTPEAKDDAVAKAKAEAQAKAEAETKAKAEAQAKVDAEAKAKADAAQALIDDTAAVVKARSEFESAAKAANLNFTRLTSRMKEFENRATNSGVSLKQVAATYTSLTELLNATKNGPHLDAAARQKLAELVMHNVARPTKIDQGSHPTCNVTTLEVYMAARHPDVYADLVKQIALTGEFVTTKKEIVHLPKAATMPGEDEKNFDMDKPASNKRNHASQLIQLTLINGVYETGRYHSTDSRGKKIDCTGYRYVMGPPVKTYFTLPDGSRAYTTDEDKLIDGKGNQIRDSRGQLSTSPIFIGDDVLAASEMALGYKMPYLDSPYKVENQPWVFDLPTKERLLKYKADGKFPLGVPTMMGNHVQTIHDVVEENGKFWILIDNQHGEGEDGWITLSELHKTMQDASYDLKVRKTRP
jgi:hypothetical protein